VTSLREIAEKHIYFEKKESIEAKETPYQLSTFTP